jgi:hypothetical protein
MRQAGHLIAGAILVVLTHHAAVIPHEYAHSFMAWALGYKSDPLAIHWGGTSAVNLLLLIDINEQVDYAAMFARGDGLAAALVGFAGPGLANGSLYLVSLWLLQRPDVRRSLLLFTFVFWFNFMNIGNFFDYVPIRTFAATGDIAHITQGLGISPWAALVVLGLPTGLAMWHFYACTLPAALGRIAPESPFRRALIVIATVVIMFGYFGLVGIEGYGQTAHVLTLLSLCLIPVMLIACWPTRRWMQAGILASKAAG